MWDLCFKYMGTYHLFVKGDRGNAISISLLRAILDMIRDLVAVGVRLVIHKITPQMLGAVELRDKFKEMGISSLPAMVFNDVEIVIGSEAIRGQFEALLSRTSRGGSARDAHGASRGISHGGSMRGSHGRARDDDSEGEVHDFMRSELERKGNEGDDQPDTSDAMLHRRYTEVMGTRGPRDAPPRRGARGGGEIDTPLPSAEKAPKIEEMDSKSQARRAYAGVEDAKDDDIDLLSKMMDNMGYEM